jgi:Na+/proline symporter
MSTEAAFALLLPLILASLVFLGIGLFAGRKIRALQDFIPVSRSDGIRLVSRRQFSATTISQTISLATIIAAYFNLASYLGLWLLWTAATASAGMFLVYAYADSILAKLKLYASAPTLHEFLATEYSLHKLQPLCASLTVIGLLLLLATELLVGGRFLSAAIDPKLQLPITIGLSVVVLSYVVAGGFGTVVISDQIQMVIIWLMIPAIGIAIFLANQDVPTVVLQKATQAIAFPLNTPGLLAFLLGILLMNVPTHLSSMPLWQRMAACANENALRIGLLRSSMGIFVSWTLLVIVAWFAAVTLGGNNGAEIFRNVLSFESSSTFAKSLRFLIVLGLYSALLSTASTLMIAISHTFTTDILGASAPSKLPISRLILIVATMASCAVVVIFEHFGYQIEDIIFSIYGGALSLCPAVILALRRPRNELRRYGKAALLSIAIGFCAGWLSAIIGKWMGQQTLIFMSPAIGMGAAAVVLLTFSFFAPRRAENPR